MLSFKQFYDNGHYYLHGTNDTIEYRYDANGNMISDANKGIVNITYNELNLPLQIIMKDNNRIEYIYDAAGVKKRQIENHNGKIAKTTDLVGNFVYDRNKPAWHTFDEGRVIYKPDSTYFAETYIKDHLGNIRVAYGNDGVKDGIRQVMHITPLE